MAPTIDKEGFWGQPTSTLDWCEENYVVTSYVAEFWNTISNVVMIVPPAVNAFYYWRIGMELRYALLNVALLVVGIGSWLFHMTLKYEMQLLDELPMIYGTASLIYVMHARHDTRDIFKPVTQLHAWWHLFSGAASSLQIVFSAHARMLHQKRESSVQLLGFCWPYLSVRTKP